MKPIWTRALLYMTSLMVGSRTTSRALVHTVAGRFAILPCGSRLSVPISNTTAVTNASAAAVKSTKCVPWLSSGAPTRSAASAPAIMEMVAALDRTVVRRSPAPALSSRSTEQAVGTPVISAMPAAHSVMATMKPGESVAKPYISMPLPTRAAPAAAVRLRPH